MSAPAIEIASTSRKSARPGKGEHHANKAVYGAIRAALLSGRIPAGQKLQEPAIARALGVSRERVRRALHRLAHEGWLVLVPNKGAFVRVPTLEEIDEMTGARRVIEVAAIAELARRRDPAALKRLDGHLAAEAAALRRRDRAEQISLSAEFHVLICELVGNRYLLKFQREIMSVSQLFYAFHIPLEVPRCGGPDEHPAIVAAVREGNERLAVKLVGEHLSEMLKHFRHQEADRPFEGFSAIFRKIERA